MSSFQPYPRSPPSAGYYTPGPQYGGVSERNPRAVNKGGEISLLSFHCDRFCQCPWRKLLNNKGIYSLELPVTGPADIFNAFQQWMDHKPSLSTGWSQSEIETILFVIECLMAALSDFPADKRACWMWTRRVVLQTGFLPISFILHGVERISNYPITGGGFADVYTGSYQGRQVAIKVLRIFPQNGWQNNLRKDTAHEILFWKSLKHPHILQFIGVSHDAVPPHMGLVSPWMPNGNIMQYIERNPRANKLMLLDQSARGLCHLHNLDLPLVHGDIKPANILIDAEGNAQISDFGITAISETETFPSTVDGGIDKGTVQYMAPELFEGGAKRSRASDVYAFAITVLEVLASHIPFPKSNSVQIIMAVSQGAKPQRPASRCAIPDDTWNLVCQCWEKQPAARPSMFEVEKRLSEQMQSVDPVFTFDCRPNCQCLWRELLHRRSIYSLSLPVDGYQKIYLALKYFMGEHKSDLDIHLRNWTGREIQLLLALIESVIGRYQESTQEWKDCLGWEVRIVTLTSRFPASLILDGMERNDTATHAGEHADVYRGKHMGRYVAIKMFKDDAILSRQFRGSRPSDSIIIRDILAWRRMTHPNILPLLGVSWDSSQLHLGLITLWMSNNTLLQYTIANPRVDKVLLLAQSTDGLVYIHQFGFIHGSVSAMNILVDSKGVARISGFSSSRATKGSLSLDQNNDVYALGKTIFQVYAGAEEPNIYTVYSPSRPGDPPRKLDIPKEIRLIADRCMRSATAEKFRNSQEAANEFDAILHARASGRNPKPNATVLWGKVRGLSSKLI